MSYYIMQNFHRSMNLDSKLLKAKSAFSRGDYNLASQLYEEVSKEIPSLSTSASFLSDLSKRRAATPKSGKDSGVETYGIDVTLNSERGANKSDLPARHMLNNEMHTVDIVITVYNAKEYSQRCIESVARNRDGFKGKIIVINDASDEPTTKLLEELSMSLEDVVYVHHEENLGYTKSANNGLKRSSADYTVLLNSDTVVTPGWIQSIIRCFKSSKLIGIVGPLGNAATWQNVPCLLDDTNQFAINQLPSGISIDKMAEIARMSSKRVYPRVPFVNGFCFAVSKSLITKIGLLDEDAFPIGYGEENDLCIRARQAGFDLAIADDCYIFHAKSKSFGSDRKKLLGKQGREKLQEKHGTETVAQLIEEIKVHSGLDCIRENFKKHFESCQNIKTITRAPIEYPEIKKSYLFLLPVSGGGGGVHSIVQECIGINNLGLTAKIAVPRKHIEKFISRYSEIDNCCSLFIPFDPKDINSLPIKDAVVIATIYTSVKIARQLKKLHPESVFGYYIQDYEPLFSDENTPSWQEAFDSYALIDGAILFAKTNWIREKIYDAHGLEVHKVSPSIDHGVYHPNIAGKRLLKTDHSKFTISAMIRPKTPRRGAERTMRVLKDVQTSIGGSVSIHIFGTNESDPLMNGLTTDFNYVNHGFVDRKGVATILQASDLFIDLSDYQAFGRTGLEAMACGAAVVSTQYGGIEEYMQNGINGLMVDPYNEREAVKQILHLLQNTAKLEIIKKRALATAQEFNITRAAISEVLVLSGLD